jgi:hypothetical protein
LQRRGDTQRLSQILRATQWDKLSGADLDLKEEKERRDWIALMHRVAGSAFGDDGKYVGQESFITGTAILALAWWGIDMP